MPRRNLANLIQSENDNQQKITEPKSEAIAKVARTVKPPTQEIPKSDSQPQGETTAPAKYSTLVVKYTRLREEQIDQLNAIARRINHAKRGGERITENTLIRVAVDALLLYPERLKGISEEELFTSFTQASNDSA